MRASTLLALAAASIASANAIGIRTRAPGASSFVRTEVIVDKPSQCVWAIAKDPEKFPDFIPRLSKSTRLEKVGNEERFFVVINPPFPFKEIAHVLAVEFDDPGRIVRWRMVEGNILQNEGSVSLTEKGAQTKVDMQVRLEMGGAWPLFLVTWGVKYYLPKIVAGFKGRAMASDCPKVNISPSSRTPS